MWGPEQIKQAVSYLKEAYAETPEVALILGSGLGPFADSLGDAVTVAYQDIPNYPVSTVSGHAGQLVFGKAGDTRVVAMQGRFHIYEGYAAEAVAFPVRVFAALGIKKLLVTNAAGGVGDHLRPGDLMLITDHINLMGTNPLIGPNHAELGPRFPDLSEAYAKPLRAALNQAAQAESVELKEGIYLAVTGPAYETPAEIQMYRALGGDAAGMSTVPEVVAANHAGMQVCGVSCITNMGAGLGDEKLDHAEVTETASLVMDQFVRLLTAAIPRIAKA